MKYSIELSPISCYLTCVSAIESCLRECQCHEDCPECYKGAEATMESLRCGVAGNEIVVYFQVCEVIFYASDFNRY